MNKLVKVLVVLVVVLLLVIVLGNLFLQQQLKRIRETDFSEIMPEIENLSSEQAFKPQIEKEVKEFISSDKKLIIEYSSKWIETTNQDVKRVFSEKQIQKYNLSNLFLAQRIEISGEFAQLIVDQGFFNIQDTFEEIIDEMQKASFEQGWNMEVIESKTENNQITFEARYQKSKSYSVYSKEKIIFLEPEESDKKAYLISFITLDKDWAKFEQEADEIFSSIQLNS